ncbi:hypothetical protein [Acetobacterium sp.]|uniref:hypothetical protein n=1 Tax=Acetobacterium sp. TaxID=1872094 RepID=UPI0035941961
MKSRWIKVIRNNNGSALPFVIILGVVLLLIVASLMTVATGGMNFTQKTVESRQAYIDAKSVTEYGQILIEEKITEMNDPLNPLADKGTTNTAGDVIFYINGTRSGPTDPMILEKAVTASASTIGVGKLKWEQTELTGDAENGTAKTTYTLSVETQNLRRKLNYERSFDYAVETVTTPGTGSIPVPPTQPQKPTINLNQFSTTGLIQKTKINNQNKINFKVTGGQDYGIGNPVENSNGLLSVRPSNGQFNNCQINITSFAFDRTKSLDVAANKIALSTSMPDFEKLTLNFGVKEANTFKTELLYFANNYSIDSNESKNTLKAKDIYIKGDLILGFKAKLDIDCDNLWITGDVDLSKLQTSGNIIKAKNIIIGGDLTIGHATTLTIDCSNVWLDGSVKSNSSTPILTFNNVQYLKTGTMNLNDKMRLTIVGDPDQQTNQVEIGSLDTTSTGQQVDIKGIYYFNCLGNITQNWSNATINIDSKIVMIGGNLNLEGIKGGDFKILTEYFVCKGNTTLQQIEGPFYIGNVDQKTSCIKFEGTYTQTDAKVVLYGNTNIVFGGNVTLGNWGNRVLDLTSDHIYFSGSANFNSNQCILKGAINQSLANVWLKSQTSNPSRGVGKYIGYTTNTINDNTLKPGSFDAIDFPPPPTVGATEGETTNTVNIVDGQEKYY